jgi:hypothetical protein
MEQESRIPVCCLIFKKKKKKNWNRFELFGGLWVYKVHWWFPDTSHIEKSKSRDVGCLLHLGFWAIWLFLKIGNPQISLESLCYGRITLTSRIMTQPDSPNTFFNSYEEGWVFAILDKTATDDKQINRDLFILNKIWHEKGLTSLVIKSTIRVTSINYYFIKIVAFHSFFLKKKKFFSWHWPIHHSTKFEQVG